MHDTAWTRLDALNDKARAPLAFSPLQYMFDYASEAPARACVYVDDAASPRRTALLIGHYLFLGGDMRGVSVNALIERAPSPLIVFYEDASAAFVIKQACERVWDNERSVFVFEGAPHEKPAPDSGIAPITRALMASDTQNIEMISDEVLGTGTYASMDDFCARGIGFAHIHAGRVRAFATSEYPSARAVGVGIEVEEMYRRQGIATRMTRALVNEARARGKLVYWECWKQNAPSVSTALKCGFKHVADYKVLIVDLQKGGGA